MLRILIGHLDIPLPEYDTSRYDVRVVRYTEDGQRPPATIAEMLAQCPPGWQPDIYYHAALIHFPIPADIEEFSGLTATNIQDWHRGGRAVWAGAGFFDLIAAERNSAALLAVGGYSNARFCRFWGVNPALHRLLPQMQRDIDVLFIGSLHSEIWEDRNRWLDRLARLSDRYRILITTGHFGEDYVSLTNRARIVFNRSVNGCTNQRAYDAPACGALVFNETENSEARETFVEDEHCVYYADADFEQKLDYYLQHEQERARIAAAGQAHVLAAHTEAVHFQELLALLEAHLPLRGVRPNARLSQVERCRRKALQIYGCSLPVSAPTAADLMDEASRAGLAPALVQEAHAALHGWVAHYACADAKIKLLTVAIDSARRAVRSDPASSLAQMTLAFLLIERAQTAQGAHPTGRNDIAEAAVALSTSAEQCEEALESDSADGTAPIEGFGYPRWGDLFDCRIERAYLLRGVSESEWAREVWATIAWRCRTMLSDLAFANGQREEAYRQALAAANDLPEEAQALLRLARYEALVGKLDAAVLHYKQGLERTPLECAAWPELAALLAVTGRQEEAKAFAAERLRVIEAIPAFAAIRQPLLEAIK